MALQATGFMADRHDLTVAFPANPLVGQNLIWAVPAGKVIQVVGIQILLTTSVVVANRIPFVAIITVGLDRLPFSPSFVQAANVAFTHSWSMGVAPSDMSADMLRFSSPLACCYQAKPGETITVEVTNIDVGDQIANVAIRYLEWNEG